MECDNDKDIMQEVIKIESMVRDIYDAVVEKEDKRVCPICNNVLTTSTQLPQPSLLAGVS